MQTNTLSLSALVCAVAMGLISLVEINASRPYKALKQSGELTAHQTRYEAILKSISLAVILLSIGMVLWRLQH